MIANNLFWANLERELFYTIFSSDSQQTVDELLDGYPNYASRWFGKYLLGTEKVYGKYEAYLTSLGEKVFNAKKGSTIKIGNRVYVV